MIQGLWFTKVPAVVSSLLLVGAYVYVRSGGTLAGLTTQETAPVPTAPVRSMLPGSKSKPIFLRATPPTDQTAAAKGLPTHASQTYEAEDPFLDARETLPASPSTDQKEPTSQNLNAASPSPASISYPTSLSKPARATFAEQQRMLMPGSKSMVISQPPVVALRPNPAGLENPLATQPPKNPIVTPRFRAKP